MNEQNWHYIDAEDNPQGPFSGKQLKDLVQDGTITEETAVWTEETGDIWIPASNVDGLFPEDIEDVDENEDVEDAPPSEEDEEAEVEDDQQTQLALPLTSDENETLEDEKEQEATSVAFASKPVSSPSYVPEALASEAAVEEDVVESAFVKKVSYTSYLALVVMGYLVVFVSQFFSGSVTGKLTFDAKQMVLLAGILLSFLGGVLGFVYTSRAWSVLKPHGIKGYNVWLLCVPVFNCFWAFKVFADLAKQWAAVQNEEQSDTFTPSISYSLMLWHASGFLIGSLTWGSMLANMYLLKRGGEPGVIFNSLGHPFTVFMTWSVFTVVSLVAMRSITNAVNSVTQSRAQDDKPREIEPQLI